MFVNDFTTRFKLISSNTTSVITNLRKLATDEHNEMLIRLIRLLQDSEIKDAIFQMDKYKSPGPDSFGTTLF